MNILQIILLMTAIETPNCNCEGDLYCYCTGDNGNSRGSLQISEIFIEDVNRIYDMDYTWEDAYNRKTARDITFLWHMNYVNEDRIGRPVTVEDHVRCHCAGPDGWKQSCSVSHWNKAERYLAMEEMR